MKAWALTGIEMLELIEVSRPSIINEDDVLVRITAVGVCGSDVHYYLEGGIVNLCASWRNIACPIRKLKN